MEAEPDLARAYLDAINAFGDMERPCIRAALATNIFLHPLIPLYGVLYTRGIGEMWYYDELGNFVICVLCRRSVRQGHVMGTIILCIKVKPAYGALLGLLCPGGFLFSYTDDVHMGGKPPCVAQTITAIPRIYKSVGLMLGRGHKKIELVLS
jgi:hypothetical protein